MTGRRHGLEAFLRDAPRDDDPGVEVRILRETGFVNLRGDVNDARFAEAVQRATGQPPPGEPDTFFDGEHRTYWLGPDEWLIGTAGGAAPALAGRLEDALGGLHAAVNDVSGGNVAIALHGPAARDILAAGCTLDLHPKVFTPGTCAQTGLAKAGVLLALRDESPTFEIIVRRSFSDYLARWLAHVSRRAGRSFSAA